MIIEDVVHILIFNIENVSEHGICNVNGTNVDTLNEHLWVHLAAFTKKFSYNDKKSA